MYYEVPAKPRPVLNVVKPVEYYTLDYRFRRHVYQAPLTQVYVRPPPKVFYQPPPIRLDIVKPPMICGYYAPHYYTVPAVRHSQTYWPPAYRVK